MAGGCLRELSLNYEKETRCTSLHRLVAAKHHPKLMFFMKALRSFHERGYEVYRASHRGI